MCTTLLPIKNNAGFGCIPLGFGEKFEKPKILNILEWPYSYHVVIGTCHVTYVLVLALGQTWSDRFLVFRRLI
jgi:hypothetical protein